MIRDARRVLVTGAAGFLGSHITEACAQAGHEVQTLDAFLDNYDPEVKRRNVAEMRVRCPGLAPVAEVDLRDARTVHDAMGRWRPEIVVHCAALAGIRPSLQRPARYSEHNVTATINLLEAMRSVGCRKLVFASSSSVYGSDAPVPFTEDHPAVRPASPYAATKRACELLLHTYADLYDLDYLALRFFTVYGPRQRPDLAIHMFTAAILQAQPITLYGDGSSSRDYTHVDDVVAGVMTAVDHAAAEDGVREIVNLGSAAPTLLRDLVAMIEKACDREALIRWRPDQPGDVPRTYADLAKAERLLGYAPQRDLVEGVEEFVSWWRSRFMPTAV